MDRETWNQPSTKPPPESPPPPPPPPGYERPPSVCYVQNKPEQPKIRIIKEDSRKDGQILIAIFVLVLFTVPFSIDYAIFRLTEWWQQFEWWWNR